MKKYYVAYGSNLNIRQMRMRCPDAEIAGIAEIKDYRLLFKGSKTGSYLTIEKARGHRVPVAVWEISEADEKRLDRYEGFPEFYYKKNMKLLIHSLTGERWRRSTFVYIMDERRLPGLPTYQYMETCLDGYEDFGFDPEILDEAFRYSGESMR